jgi:hypothetical protein
VERPGDPGEETAVEIYHTKEPLHGFAISGFREVQNDLNVVPEGGDASSRELRWPRKSSSETAKTH